MRVRKDKNTAGVGPKLCYPEFHTHYSQAQYLPTDLGEYGNVVGVGKRFSGSARDDKEEKHWEMLETDPGLPNSVSRLDRLLARSRQLHLSLQDICMQQSTTRGAY